MHILGQRVLLLLLSSQAGAALGAGSGSGSDSNSGPFAQAQAHAGEDSVEQNSPDTPAPPPPPILSGRIVNGVEAPIESTPFQVAIETERCRLLCGGSIIGPHWVLTAAHCLLGHSVRMLRVRAGSSEHARGGSLHRVVSGERHPMYRAVSSDYDVAVMRVEPDFTLDSSRRVALLATPGTELKSRTKVIVSGWGLDKEGGRHSMDKLRKTELSLVHHFLCRVMYALGGPITERMLCASSWLGSDACAGDSGGPLVTEIGMVQVGIVSFGQGCGRLRFPGVYTNLANPEIRSFIKNVSGI